MRKTPTIRSQFPSWKRIPGTYGLILVTVLWYVVIETMSGHSITGLMQAGALAGVAIHSGQWYRLISALFVHLSMIHLFLNMISLYSLFFVELLFGTRAFLVLYGLAGLAGNVISILWMDPFVLTAGASGAVFGIFGAIFALSFQGVLTKTLRNQLILLLAANLILDLSHPDINLIAHLGGFAVGIIFTWAIRRYRFSHRFWTMSASFTVLMFAIGLIGTRY